jgi:hypothetical protein
MWKHLSTALVIVSFAVVPRAVRAQWSCGYFQACGPMHYFELSQPNSDYAHTNCMYCWDEIDHYPVCHPTCNMTLADPLLKVRFEAVVAAAEKGDVGSVLILASDVPGFVMWNAERQAVQIKSCSLTSLIASLPVRDPMMVAIAQKLPSVQVAMAGTSMPSRVSR